VAIFKPPEYLKSEYLKKGKDRHWLVVRIKHGLKQKTDPNKTAEMVPVKLV